MFDGYLTRSQAARELGLSVARIRQLEKDRTLYAHKDWSGVHWFDPDDIEALREARASARGEGPDEPRDEDPGTERPRRAARVRCPHCGRRLRVRVE